MLCFIAPIYTQTNSLRCLPSEFCARGSGHKIILTLQKCLIKTMFGYIFHKYVAFSLFVYLREHVFCNHVGGQGRFLAVLVFNLLHMRIQDRVITGLSDGKTIGIA